MTVELLKNRDYIKNNMLSASEKRFTGACEYHRHDFFEIELILDGGGVYELDGVPYEARRGDLFLMNPSNVHAVRDADLSLINVMFLFEDKASLSEVTAWLLAPRSVYTLDGETFRFLSPLFAEIVAVSEEKPAYAMQLLQAALWRLSLTYPLAAEAAKPSYVERAIFYMHKNFASDITLDGTARHLGLSPAYFSDIFHKASGVGWKTYLDDLRFSYAEKLLRYTALSVKEVHFRSGFLDYANFARRFRKRNGVSPTEFRNAHKM